MSWIPGDQTREALQAKEVLIRRLLSAKLPVWTAKPPGITAGIRVPGA